MSNHWGWILGLGITLATATSCRQAPDIPVRNVNVLQKWTLTHGQEIAGYRVIGGLGDISIDLKGNPVRAPFEGKVEPTTTPDCVVFSSPEVPAYLFRLCGLTQPNLGELRAGAVIGRGQILQFAALRRQPDGSWAIVEPAVDILEQAIQ